MSESEFRGLTGFPPDQPIPGPRGPDGLTGPTGIVGSTGPTGPTAGVHSHTATLTTRTNTAGLAAGAVGSVTASCVGGEVATGGGCWNGGVASGFSPVLMTAPSGGPPPTAWACTFHNSQVDPITIVAYVVCQETPIT